MNSFVENLNQWGGRFVDLAWPMLWQSSLLILVVFTVDFLVRRKIRASIRYALWLIVLVKLCLPPALALPTGAAWWLFPKQAATRTPVIPQYVVTYDTTAPIDPVLPNLPILVPPPPKLDGAGWTLLGCGCVAAGLLLWLTFRWWQISRKISCATTSEEFTNLLEEIRVRAGLRSAIQLKLVEDRMSPAVCGLLHPVILLPRMLAEQLSVGQLRAVLLHEVFHLQRRDVWVNCAQALLQIIYWWHPLLWLANARIRRVREEAVDDAVMLALRDEGDSYAPTLLAVAKLAFSRPLMSLGLVGIMESRSALRKRIERLVNFRAPHKAGLTLLSLCGIFIFSAVALPMGGAPGQVEKSDSMDTAAVAQQSLTLKVNPEIFIKNAKAQAAQSLLSPTNDYTVILLDLLRTEGVDCAPPNGIAFNTRTGEITTQNTPDKLEIFRQVIEQLNRADGPPELPLSNNLLRQRLVVIEARIYQMPSANFDDFVSGLRFYRGRSGEGDWWSASPEKFSQLIGKLETSGLRLMQRPRIQTGSGITAEFFVGNGTNNVEFGCKPCVGDGFVDLTLQGTVAGVQPASSVFTNYFNTKASAENHGGIVVRVKNYGGNPDINLVAAIGVEIITNAMRFSRAVENSGSRQLVQDGKVLYEMGKFDQAEERLKSALTLEPENQAAHYYMNLVEETKAGRGSQAPQAQVRRKQIVDILNRVRVDQFGPSDHQPLKAVVDELNQLSAGLGSEKTGIHFSLAEKTTGRPPKIDANTGLPLKAPVSSTADINFVTISMAQPLTKVTLADALDAIVLTADKPIEYWITENGVFFSLRNGPEAPRLYSRTIRVDTNTFPAKLQVQSGSITNPATILTALMRVLSRSGVKISPPDSIFYNDRLGLLFVRATEPELDKVERILATLNCLAPQIQIKARFIELPGSAASDVYLGSVNVDAVSTPAINSEGLTVSRSHNSYQSFTGILTQTQFQNALRAIKHNPGFEELAAPEGTTVSGRQMQMRATQVIMIITNFALREMPTNSVVAIMPQTNAVETGPVIDVIPNVLADGYTIDLSIIASVNEFLGYDKTTNTTVGYTSRGQKINLPTILPRFAVRKASARVQLLDGQTALLGAMKWSYNDSGKDVSPAPAYFKTANAGRDHPKEQDRQLLVFITVTLVDPAGHRIHSDEEMPFARNSVPPQVDP